MKQIQAMSNDVHQWLIGGSVHLNQWALCKDEGYRWGHTSTNMAKYFKKILHHARLLPIKACVEYTFNQSVDLWLKKIKITENLKFALPKQKWKKYTKNEMKAWDHKVQLYNSMEGIYCVTTAV